MTVHGGEATAVPVGDLDAVMLRHVLAHNGGSERALVDHLATRVRPGGWVYLVDADLTVTQVVGADPFLVEMNRRYPDFQRARGNEPQAGLLLARRLRAAGLVDVVHRGRWAITDLPPGYRSPSYAARDAMQSAGVVTADELMAWTEALAVSDTLAERPTSFVAVFAAWGRRPA